MLDPRERAYEEAAARRGGRPARHWYDRPAVAAGCVVIGFLLAVAYVHTNRGAPEATKVHDRLVQRVRSAERDAEKLDAQAHGLETSLDAARNAALPDTSQLGRTIALRQLLAGQLAVVGPGLRVTLSEPTQSAQPTGLATPGARTPVVTPHILIDRDVRSVVNELWSDGAEAIAVNGIRLTPTSAIRFAGDAVLVDFAPIASPYVIEAVGNADSLATRFATSDVASRYQTLSSAKGIGFSFADQTHLGLPAGQRTTLRYAVVAR